MKLYICNANIYFNQKRFIKHLTPNYAMIKIPNTYPASKFTQHKAYTLGIKYEIKYSIDLSL